MKFMIILAMLYPVGVRAQDYSAAEQWALEQRIDQLERDQRDTEAQRQADEFNRQVRESNDEFSRQQQENSDRFNEYIQRTFGR